MPRVASRRSYRMRDRNASSTWLDGARRVASQLRQRQRPVCRGTQVALRIWVFLPAARLPFAKPVCSGEPRVHCELGPGVWVRWPDLFKHLHGRRRRGHRCPRGRVRRITVRVDRGRASGGGPTRGSITHGQAERLRPSNETVAVSDPRREAPSRRGRFTRSSHRSGRPFGVAGLRSYRSNGGWPRLSD